MNLISQPIRGNTFGRDIAQTGEANNVDLGNVQNGAEGLKGIWNEIKNFATGIGKALKNFLFATANFLKNNGVRIGVSLGIAVGVLAVVGAVASLPVSLPVLAGIAGTIFAIGVIGKLIKNIRDPNVQGAANVIKQTLNDIKNDVVMGAKRTLTYITSPKTLFTDIKEGIINNEKSIRGYESNMKALGDICSNSNNKLGEDAKTLIGELKECIEKYRKEIKGSSNPSVDTEDSLKNKILKALEKLNSSDESVRSIQTSTGSATLGDIAENLIDKFEDKGFIDTLRKDEKTPEVDIGKIFEMNTEEEDPKVENKEEEPGKEEEQKVEIEKEESEEDNKEEGSEESINNE